MGHPVQLEEAQELMEKSGLCGQCSTESDKT